MYSTTNTAMNNIYPTPQEFNRALMSLKVRSRTGHHMVHATSPWIVVCLYPDFNILDEWVGHTPDYSRHITFDHNISDVSSQVTYLQIRCFDVAVPPLRVVGFARAILSCPSGKQLPMLDMLCLSAGQLGKRAISVVQTVYYQP